MSVTILTARAHRLFAPVVEALGQCARKGEEVLLLVPEQFTLAAERGVMERLSLTGMFLIDVMSPSRLSEQVLAAAGRDGREPLDAAGRRMALSQALERLEDKLPYYGSIAQRRGFVEKLDALITDMKRGGLDPDRLKDYADTLPAGSSRDKLIDLAKVYAQYREVLRGRFSDSEDQLAYVAGRLADSGFLRDKHLFVYGFDTLPEQLMRLLSAAAPLCKSLTIALICDAKTAPDGELYAPVRQGIARFQKMLFLSGESVQLHALPPQLPDRPEAIAYLDRALFAHPAPAFAGKPEGVYLSDGLSPYEEAALMTREGALAAGPGRGPGARGRVLSRRGWLRLCRDRRPGGQRHSLLHRPAAFRRLARAGAVLAGGPARHGGRLAQPRHALPDQKRLCAP